MTESTSIYAEYIQITKTYQNTYGENTILLMQVGAFFEVYGFRCSKTGDLLDSKIEEFSQMCNLNMSEKKIAFENRQVVMAGFRDYSLDKYLQKIMDYGFTAVVYVQDKSGKNVVRVLDAVHSPGTYLSYDTENLPQMSNNIMCIWFGRAKSRLSTALTNRDTLICGVSSVNIFTGKSALYEFERPYEIVPTTFDELERCVAIYSPNEVVFISHFSKKDTESIVQFSGLSSKTIHYVNSETSDKTEKCCHQKYMQHILGSFFGQESMQICSEFSTYPTATQSFCYLLDFIQDHNPNLVKRISIPDIHSTNKVILANHTLKQLNILSGDYAQTGSMSSVSSFLNKCCSAMGRRKFHSQIVAPVIDIKWLTSEYKTTGIILEKYDSVVPESRRILGKIRDLDKMCRQIVVRKIYPSTLAQLYESLLLADQLVSIFEYTPIKTIYLEMTEVSSKGILEYLDSKFYMDKCKNVSGFSNIDESFIKPGVSFELDRVYDEYCKNVSDFQKIHEYFNRIIQSESKNIDTTEYVKIHETEKSGSTLQITKKRGAVLKGILAKRESWNIPGTDIEIKSADVKFVSASGSADEIEFPIVNKICRTVLQQKDVLQKLWVYTYLDTIAEFETLWYNNLEKISAIVAVLDVVQCKAYVAKEYNYCCPEIDADESCDKSYVKANELRHCLIEHIQQNEIYVPNDIHIGCDSRDGMLVYGTNAVGKTSLIRALGISVIMAQSGMYVPCSSFKYRPYTAIFSRILGNDNLFKGLSTFAVEMSELRIILKMADKNSLVLGDELCSGTETESALSIFVAGLEHLYKARASFVFATHFHEIIGYDEVKALENLALVHMSVLYNRELDILVYDRKLCDGPGNKMYGLEVCKSLHLDESFLENAYKIREKYFAKSLLSFPVSYYNSGKIRGMCEICKEELGEETHHLEPQKYANEDGFIGVFHKNHAANLISVCSKCHDKCHEEESLKIVRKKTNRGYMVM